MASLEWQVAEGSRTAHIIDTEVSHPKRSGPKALCGRRPQRTYRWWFALPVDEPDAKPCLRRMDLVACADCNNHHPAAAADPSGDLS